MKTLKNINKYSSSSSINKKLLLLKNIHKCETKKCSNYKKKMKNDEKKYDKELNKCSKNNYSSCSEKIFKNSKYQKSLDKVINCIKKCSKNLIKSN
jgi:hypothetical protein